MVAPPRRALPFGTPPPHLDGSMVGDAGFDPLSIATTETLPRMRQAETRHGRLAMVATWGWPVAQVTLGLLQKIVPPASVCTGTGCAIDARLVDYALQLDDIAAASRAYWGALLLLAAAGELRTRQLGLAAPDTSEPAFDPLGLWTRADFAERERLELAELKHGRVAMCALLVHWSAKLATSSPAGLTFAHQLWGQTCVVNLLVGSGICYPQDVQTFDFVLSWEIMYRVVTGYFAEPYF